MDEASAPTPPPHPLTPPAPSNPLTPTHRTLQAFSSHRRGAAHTVQRRTMRKTQRARCIPTPPCLLKLLTIHRPPLQPGQVVDEAACKRASSTKVGAVERAQSLVGRGGCPPTVLVVVGLDISIKVDANRQLSDPDVAARGSLPAWHEREVRGLKSSQRRLVGRTHAKYDISSRKHSALRHKLEVLSLKEVGCASVMLDNYKRKPKTYIYPLLQGTHLGEDQCRPG